MAGTLLELGQRSLRLDDQHSVLDTRVFFPRVGVELRLVVADEARFVGPPGGVGKSGFVEFIAPDELPFVCLGGRPDRCQDEKRRQCFHWYLP